jgi:hypothetical protein
VLSDGKESEKVGGFSLDKKYDFEDQEIGKVLFKKRSGDNYVNYMEFWNRKGDQLLKLEGSSTIEDGS